MGKTAFIFPGQGAQVCGMGKDFYEKTKTGRQVFEQASELLGFSMEKLCFEPNDRLDQTEYTQPAMVTNGIAILKVMEEMGFHADVTAGLSLGEYCALAAAGVMSEEDAIQTVRYRGILMQEAVPTGVGGMSAVLGINADLVNEIVDCFPDVQVANYNCPGQIVISGRLEALTLAEEKLKKAGARKIISLNVSGPFHSVFLEDAGKELGRYLEKIEVHDPVIPYVSNVTAEYVTSAANVKELLIRQISSSVRWQESVETMLANGVNQFVEIGPGRTLSGFIKKIDRNAAVFQVAEMKDLERLKLE